MKSLKEYFKQARDEHWAIGHFNFSFADQLKAFVETAKELGSPLMVATSENEALFVGYNQAVALVKSYQEAGHPIFLNADHHKGWQTATRAVDAGYDTIHIDASALPFERNIELTKEVVKYAKSKNPDMMVEGELGYLRGSSKVQEKVEIFHEDYTKPKEAEEFVEKTGIDRLAIAFGNVHGITTDQTMHLDIDVLRSIREVVPDVHIVLHGGSGLSDEEVEAAIAHGVTNVHVNTELRIAYHDAMEEELAKDDESATPYEFAKPAVEATKEMIEKKLKLFGY
ncbi:MAG: class II fructose-bisphosphate aldolase [Parcubacteria group bacterium]